MSGIFGRSASTGAPEQIAGTAAALHTFDDEGNILS
jgi:hypothetical protein